MISGVMASHSSPLAMQVTVLPLRDNRHTLLQSAPTRYSSGHAHGGVPSTKMFAEKDSHY